MQAVRVLAATVAVMVAVGWASGQTNGLGELPAFAELDAATGPPTQSASQPLAAEATAPAPKWTRQPDFFIPFEIAEYSAEPPAEVRLYMSSDRGKNWNLYQQQRPDARKFQFSAQSDGEYWFAVRTADTRGQLIAHRGWTPELVVIVDTQRPKLDLNVEIGNYGDVKAQWVAQDPNLATDSFRLRYQDARSGQWKDVKVRPADTAETGQPWGSTADWWLQPSGSEVVVRAEIADRAGNSAWAEKRTSLTRVAQGSGADERADIRRQPADTGPIQAGDPLPPQPGTWKDGVRGWQAEMAASLDNDNLDTPRRHPVSSSIAPPVASRYTPSTPAPARSTHENPRFTSSPSFELDYDLLEVGPRGARAVELWYTRDQGGTWALYGPDKDAKSPVAVTVDREGLYGFTLVVHGYDAPAPRPPQDGDAPDFTLGVDWTKPTGRITGARFGTGLNKSTLTIEWLAEDALLGDRPISLSYRESPQDSWQVIAAELPNSEPFYQWRIAEPVPPRIYLQLEVRDLAGNLTTDQLTQPVTRQGLAPKGKIRQLREISTPRQSLRPRLNR